MSKIKFCGIQPTTDLPFINQLALDYIGMVFAQNSQRFVTIAQARKNNEILNPSIKKVGVFVNAPEELIRQIVAEKLIDLIQLHGQEDELMIQHYQMTFHLPIIKTFSIQTPQDVLEASQSTADYLLFDYQQAGSDQSFDWRSIQQVNHPYFLADGIKPENLKAALAFKPYTIDLSSGIESNGVKNNQKMQTIMKIMRG